MKRRKFLQYLLRRGCIVEREGGRHTWIINPANALRSFVPRHGEIKPNMIRAICKQLDVPAPTEQ